MVFNKRKFASLEFREKCSIIFIVIVGISCVVLSLIVKKLGLSGTSSSGFGPFRLILLLSGIGLISIGLLSWRLCLFLSVRLPVIFVLVLIFDNVLYFISPILSEKTIRLMSDDARKKYYFTHPNKIKLAHNGKVWFNEPNLNIKDPDTGKLLLCSDEMGYCNEPGYLSLHSKIGINVLLLGDSFLEGGPIVEFLKKDLAPLTVYTIGFGGQGPPHWGLQFDRYSESAYFKPSQIIVLNFYAGNDITDTLKYLEDPSIPDHIKNQESTAVWPQRKFSIFKEVVSIMRHLFLYRLVPFRYNEKKKCLRQSCYRYLMR